MRFSNIRDVRALGGGQAGYRVRLDLDPEDGSAPAAVDYCALPGGGGLSDAVLAAIAAGDFAGAVQPAPAPTPAAPTAAALDQKRWLWALRRFGLRPGVEATIAAIGATDPEAAAELEAAVFGSRRFVFADAIALIEAHRPALEAHAPAIAALDPAQLAQMWAAAVAKTFDTES